MSLTNLPRPLSQNNFPIPTSTSYREKLLYVVALFRRYKFSELFLKVKSDALLFSRKIEINSDMALLQQSLLVLRYTKFSQK